MHALAPVVAFDIDNTLADYSEHFRWFAELYLQRPVVYDWSATPDGEFSDALGLEKRTYQDIKLAYRQGGMKRSIPPLDEGVRSLIEKTRQMGFQAWIATTRPWMRLDNIDPDTQFWLKRNIGQIDGLIFGEEKYFSLIDIVGKDRIVGVFDDLPENYIAATKAGLRVSLRAGFHNLWWRRDTKVSGRNHDVKPTISYSSANMLDQIIEWSS